MLTETMGYEVAIKKAWEDLDKLNPPKAINIKFLSDEYSVDWLKRRVLSLSCNTGAKDFTAILILHYLAQRLKGLPYLTNEWVDFRELSGVEGYAEAFRKRVIEPIIRKYGNNPEGLLQVLTRFPSKKANQADVGIIVEAFEGVPALITLWRPDEEFSAEANMLFDKNISSIFCTEDVVVLAGIIAYAL